MTHLGDAGPGPVVHVIDDDWPLREALANLLRSSNFAVQLHASPQAFIDAWRPGDGGCLLLDIRFPGGCGLEYQARFQAAGIPLPVILMTAHADVSSSVRGMKAGAVDFLIKPFDEEALLAALRLALERDLQRRRREATLSDVSERYASLTAREKQVLQQVVVGRMNKQIAADIGLSEVTVKVHRGTMMRKMGVRTVADLVRASEALQPTPAFPPAQPAPLSAGLPAS
jgi:FixJ family two-component response regulator